MAASEFNPRNIPIRGVAVLDDDTRFSAAVRKALDEGMANDERFEGKNTVMVLDVIHLRQTVESRLGVSTYLARLDALKCALDALIQGKREYLQLQPVPAFLFCDLLMPDYEGGLASGTVNLKTATRVCELLTMISRRWDKAFPDGPPFPLRVQFWSEFWESLDGLGEQLVCDRITGMRLSWARYTTKPALTDATVLDPVEPIHLLRQLLDFRHGTERMPWIFAGQGGRALRARVKTLADQPGSCVVVSESRVARSCLGQEFVAITQLPIRCPASTTLPQLQEQWGSVLSMPVALLIDLTTLEREPDLDAAARDLLGWMAEERGASGHRFAFLAHPRDAFWRELISRAMGHCEIVVPAPAERLADVPVMVRARCRRKLSDVDQQRLAQQVHGLSYEAIDRLHREHLRKDRLFSADDWDALGLNSDGRLVSLVLADNGARVSLECEGLQVPLSSLGQTNHAWALLFLFAQAQSAASDRLELHLADCSRLAAAELRKWPRLWRQRQGTSESRRVLDDHGDWRLDYTKDSSRRVLQVLSEWFKPIGVSPPCKVKKQGQHMLINWDGPLALQVVDASPRYGSDVNSGRRPPRPEAAS